MSFHSHHFQRRESQIFCIPAGRISSLKEAGFGAARRLEKKEELFLGHPLGSTRL